HHKTFAGASFVLNPSTIGFVMATYQLELGDASKPYRHVPMFDAKTAGRVVAGESIGDVSRIRLPVDPLEQGPDRPHPLGLVAGAAHGCEAATLRGEERVYADSWGLKASTTDMRLLFDIGSKVTMGPHLRFNIQSPVDFWRLAYVARPTANGWLLPTYRTGD